MSLPLQSYDPNITWADHTVEITYQLWDYAKTVEVRVSGNCRGFDILESAFAQHAEGTEFDSDDPEIILSRPAEDGSDEPDTLECTPDEDDCVEHWLRKLCVGIRIVKHEREAVL